MIRFRMYKACMKEMNEHIMMLGICVVLVLMMALFSKEDMHEQRLVVLLTSVIYFMNAQKAYRQYLHDIIFKRVETVNACIYGQQKFISKEERYALFSSRRNYPKAQFRLWTQSVDEDGNLMEYENTCKIYDQYPDGNEFMSFDFKLYELLEEKSGKIPKIKISKKREPERYKKEALLYARISYMKSTNLIVNIELLGQKMNKVGA